MLARIFSITRSLVYGLAADLLPNVLFLRHVVRTERNGRKRIAIACCHFWPSVGGLESRIEQFAAELLAAGYEVFILAREHPERSCDTRNGINIISVPEKRRWYGLLLWPYLLRAAVNSGTFDAFIVIQDPLADMIWALDGMTPHPRTRVIIQPVINADGYGRWKDDPRFSGGLAAILKNADAAVAMTKSGPDRQFMAAHGVNAVYLPNATSAAKGGAGFRARHGIAEDAFLILHVANLYWVKNHLGLIDAMSGVPQSWKLVMVGNPTGEPECAAAVREGLAQNPEILFLQGLDRFDVSGAMEAADVVVLCSFGEGAPNTILEAMAHGKPWVATAGCGAANDHAGGIICSLDQFPHHLAVLQSDPELRSALGRAGHRQWESELSWPQVISGWIDLVEGRNPAHPSASQDADAEMRSLKKVVADRVQALARPGAG